MPRYHPTPVKRLSSKRQQIASADENLEKEEDSCTAGGKVNRCSHYEMEIPQNINNKTAMWSSNSTPGHLSEENQNTNSKRYIHPFAHWDSIYNSQDMEATQMPIDKWMDKNKNALYIYINTHTHTKEILPFATTWMHLKVIMLSEISQTEKTNTM